VRMPLRTWLVVTALTAFALVVLFAPVSWVPDAAIYAVVVAALVAVGLVAREVHGLWAALAFAACVTTAWYVRFFTTDADAGLLDGMILGLGALVVAGVAVTVGVLVGRAVS
jgi:hypothetical protein